MVISNKLCSNMMILRNMHGFSQEKVAEMIGISRQAYAKWEKGDTIPDVEKCARLAELYDTTVDTLLHFNANQENLVIAPAPKGKHFFGSVIVNDRGQIVIPKEARETMRIQDGERLILLGDEKEGLALIKANLFQEKMKATMETVNSFVPTKPE